jgi:hypothetical protein
VSFSGELGVIGGRWYDSGYFQLQYFIYKMAYDLALGQTDVGEFYADVEKVAGAFFQVDDPSIGADYYYRIGKEKRQTQQLFCIKVAGGGKTHSAFTEVYNVADFSHFRFGNVQRGGIHLDGDIGFDTGMLSAFFCVHISIILLPAIRSNYRNGEKLLDGVWGQGVFLHL